MIPITITAEYEQTDQYLGYHGHVEVMIGQHLVARIPVKDNSRAFADYPRESVEEVVATWLADGMKHAEHDSGYPF